MDARGDLEVTARDRYWQGFVPEVNRLERNSFESGAGLEVVRKGTLERTAIASQHNGPPHSGHPQPGQVCVDPLIYYGGEPRESSRSIRLGSGSRRT